MIAFFFHYFWHILVMSALLLASGFCSASETAFFHLSRRQVRQFSISAVPIEKLAASLLTAPNRFLTALLFSNMLVNVLYFALSSMLTIQVSHSEGILAGTIVAFVCFFLLLMAGEILPKSIAYGNTLKFCLFASPVCYALLKTLSPLLGFLDHFVVQPSVRLLLHPTVRNSPVTAAQLKLLLDTTQHKGLIGKDEHLLLAEILKFGFLKVRHIMQPRVKMPACSLEMTSRQICVMMHQHRLVKIPVYAQSIDAIAGQIHLRDLLLNPQQSPSALVRPVRYVPEQKSVESLIKFFRKTGEDMAIVVDEYGGIAGTVGFKHIAEHLLEPMENESGQMPIELVGPLSYRLAADLPIYDWAEAFGIDLEETHLTTIGGFVTALLGRVPRAGDQACLKNMKFTVEKVHNHRILTVLLSLESILEKDSSFTGDAK